MLSVWQCVCPHPIGASSRLRSHVCLHPLPLHSPGSAATSPRPASSLRLDPLPLQNGELSERASTLTANISSLYSTAKLELQRKDVEIRELRERWGGCMLCMCLNVVFLRVVGVMGLLGSRPWACVCLPLDRCSLSYR